MAENKKYYYMRLKENFFDSDEMLVLESLQDGYLYSNILLKLYLRSLRSNGKLMFKDTIPYSAQMIAYITKHQIGTVERALKLFQEMGLIEILETGAIYMLDIQNYIGQASTEADRKREYREQIQREKSGFPALKDKCLDKCPDKSPPENRDKEIENRDYNNIYSLVDRKGDCKGENDLKRDKPAPPQEKKQKAKPHKEHYGEFQNVLLTGEEFKKLVDSLGSEKTSDYIERLSSYLAQTGKRYKSHYATVLNWSRKDKDKEPKAFDYKNFKPSTQGGTGNEAYKHFKPSR